MNAALPSAPADYSRDDQDRLRAELERIIAGLRQPVGRAMSTDRGDANVAVAPGEDAEIQRFATALTANRVVTLGRGFATAAFRIVRTGLGAFTLDVGGLKTIPAGTAAFVDVAHDGTAWRLVGYGAL